MKKHVIAVLLGLFVVTSLCAATSQRNPFSQYDEKIATLKQKMTQTTGRRKKAIEDEIAKVQTEKAQLVEKYKSAFTKEIEKLQKKLKRAKGSRRTQYMSKISN
jgi:septal ring factor EnvC (AmiA/AmiB activator)